MRRFFTRNKVEVCIDLRHVEPLFIYMYIVVHCVKTLTPHIYEGIFNCKHEILLASYNKVLMALECRNTHKFYRIRAKVDLGIDVAHDSESRFLRCDNVVCWMAATTFSWLYLGFQPKFPFYWLYNTLGCLYHQHRLSLVSRWP